MPIRRCLGSGAAQLLAVVVVSLLLGSCAGISEAAPLADQAIQVSGTLSNYYQSLIGDVNDTWDLEVFNSAVNKVEFGVDDRKLLEDRIVELKKRAAMAHQLNSLARQFKELVDNGAAADVATAASNLGTTLQGINALPQGPAVPEMLGKAGKELVEIQHERDVKKAAQAFQDCLTAITKLYSSERSKGAYGAITKERAVDIQAVSSYLLTNNMASGDPLLKGVPEALGLDYRGGTADKVTTDGYLALLGRRADRLADASDQVGADTEEALQGLENSFTEYLANKKVDLADVQHAISDAQGWLDEIKTLRQKPQSKGAE